MNRNELVLFHEEQMQQVLQNREVLSQQGYVKDYKDIYPDVYQRIKDKKGVAYIRGSVPVKLMALLYDVVIVYIPPIAKTQLEKRFCLNKWEELISLCQQGIIIPIIGKAEYYTANHFNDLFKNMPIKPYSLWARGIGLLDVFGMSNTLEIAKNILPVGAISSDDAIFRKWEKEYPGRTEDFIKSRIQDDIAVQYADLCIFGCKAEAESLLSLSPSDLYKNLKLLNEVRTYPILFGLESQANFDRKRLSTISTMPIKPKYYIPQALPEQELEILFQGIGINIDDVSVNDIISYHNDGLGKRLRSALSYFNNYCDHKISNSEEMDLAQVYRRAEDFQTELRQAIADLTSGQYYKKMDKQVAVTTKILQIGAVVAGAAVATNPLSNQAVSVAAIAGGIVPSIIGEIPETVAEILVKFSARNLNSKFVANMWSARKIIGDK